jgi:uncharacterized heparinase superfamily protein
MLGKGCKLGVSPSESITNIQKVESPETLDFDPVFLARFSVDELMKNKITILHSRKDFDWKSRWEFEDKSDLWNFNLHYFEFLFPLVRAWKDTGEKRYLDKTIEIIGCWIDYNPKGSNPGWASYTTALRIVTWISYYGYVCQALSSEFRKKFLSSLHAQYVYLSSHLEKDILGNHYFENLKSLILVALFFKDYTLLEKALRDFKAEYKEQILADGMHFELSPMYHKIIFEGMLRVAMALVGVGRPDKEIESYLQPMLDVAYSFENGLNRVPLFNDGGNNVAKSLDALVMTAEQMFGLKPIFKGRLEASGFYIFEKSIHGKRWKLVVDAGQPGPKYIPGHAHCDAMSYELFCDGKPIVVNCGTYAYQCKERSFFRSTAAHNTVMVNGTEQSQCWGIFRLAKRSSTKVNGITEDSITMEMTDAHGQRCTRTIKIRLAQIEVIDESPGAKLDVYVHIATPVNLVSYSDKEESKQPYAPDYGLKQNITCYRFSGIDRVTHTIEL